MSAERYKIMNDYDSNTSKEEKKLKLDRLSMFDDVESINKLNKNISSHIDKIIENQ